MKNLEGVSPISILLLRISLTGIFINAAITHLVFTEKTTARLLESPIIDFLQVFASAETHVILSGVLLFVFGFTFLLGIYTRWSAFALMGLLIPITISMQLSAGILHGPLWKNVAIAGGLLFFMLNDLSSYTLVPRKNSKL